MAEAEGKAALPHVSAYLAKRLRNNRKLAGSPTPGQPQQLPNQPCPQCGSSRFWKGGMRDTKQGPIQRFLCRDCGYRFSQRLSKPNQHVKVPGQFRVLEISDLAESAVREADVAGGKGLNALCSYSSIAECASKRMKNLAEIPEVSGLAGATKQTQDVKGKLLEFMFWMQKEGYRESTINSRITRLETLAKRGANLLDPESVKTTLALQKTWSDGTKATAVDAYTCFLEKEGLTWKPPKYKRLETIPHVPSEAELNQLIGACGRVLGTFLEGLKQTGADPGELAAITAKDINKEARTITLNHPVKGHRPRILTVSSDLIRRLEAITKDSDRIFDDFILRRAFYYKRKTTARKLSNPGLEKITFITFRHWFGTMEYRRTKDILHVQRLLGHKSIQNTLIYIDLESKLFNSSTDGFTCRIANNAGEASSLIEAGFEYVTGEYNDGGKLFRKRQ